MADFDQLLNEAIRTIYDLRMACHDARYVGDLDVADEALARVKRRREEEEECPAYLGGDR